MNIVLDSARTEPARDTSLVTDPSNNDEDSCGDAVAIIGMLRDHFAVTDEKLTRSEKVRIKQEVILDSRTCKMKQVTSVSMMARTKNVLSMLSNYQCNLTHM